MAAKRSNEQWLTDLQTEGTARTAALTDLRKILVAGLRRGLLAQVNTSAPEFESLAEDFAQEALLRILDNLGSFAGRSQFTTWAHKIALSVALTELRRKRWQDASLDGITDSEEGDYTPSLIADTAPTPEIATEQADILKRINQIIKNGLTEKQRTVIILGVIQGKPTPEVAQQMNMKANAVYKLLHDARFRLKKLLEENDLTPADVLAVFE
ncbi:MAG: sigma-70 family RNA polymerase sigma factor [Chloroflexota bacterium]|nr:sigma-70 family RNA polymerase sigma factor [Anaerolineales bacterium]MCA9976608.1 sigma-70 family RNA polymerase sigma factor [Anaerolineales bacterium]MCB8966218.1 sigma-70 family RNA polymerase sigma factor [Ardenticatenaceae bacterium]